MRKLSIAFLLVFPAACSDAEEPAPCPADRLLGDVCTGLPAEALSPRACAYTASSDAEVAAALAGAAAGECVLLKGGSYAAITLPNDVSLFGEYAGTVSVAGVIVGGGTSDIQNLSVDGGAVDVREGATAHLAAVRVRSSLESGVAVGERATATLSQCEISGAGRYGVSAFDAASVEVSQTLIDGGKGPALWLECSQGCTCAAAVTGSVKDSVLRGNSIVGMSVVGAFASLDNVLITETQLVGFSSSGGLAISECSSVEAVNLAVRANSGYGILVDDSSLSLDGASVGQNLRGLWAQKVGLSRGDHVVAIANSVFDGNRGVGVGAGEGSRMSIEGTRILDSERISIPTTSGGAVEWGYGVTWAGESTVTMIGVGIERSQVVGVLIDGPASGSIVDLALITTDGAAGFVQQGVMEGAESPDTSGTTPEPDKDPETTYDIPPSIMPDS